MSQPLYKIADDILAACESMAPNDDGEIPSESAATLDALEHDLKYKADNIARYIRELQAEATRYAAEMSRLQSLAATATKRADWLISYLFDTMKKLELNRLDTDLFKLTVCRNASPSVKLTEGEPIPPQFRRIKTEFDARAALQAHKEGQELPASITVTHGTHLRIR